MQERSDTSGPGDASKGLNSCQRVTPICGAAIAQLAEHPLSKRKVVGSSPTGGSLFLFNLAQSININSINFSPFLLFFESIHQKLNLSNLTDWRQ